MSMYIRHFGYHKTISRQPHNSYYFLKTKWLMHTLIITVTRCSNLDNVRSQSEIHLIKQSSGILKCNDINNVKIKLIA